MFRVASAQTLGPELTRLDIEAPDLARACLPGQFLMLRIAEGGERIPLTIADSDPERGSVSIIFLAVGKTTRQLSRLGEGDTISIDGSSGEVFVGSVPVQDSPVVQYFEGKVRFDHDPVPPHRSRIIFIFPQPHL